MAENTVDNKARAIRAEKQVERLERELDLLRSRIKKSTATPTGSPVLMRESDRVNFQLQEQVKDLKYQLKNQKAENTKLQETLTNKTTEYEDKLKRMREIFAQASKNIDGYRASIASKDVEIGKLKLELEECQTREQSFKANCESQQLTIEKLNTEITSSKTFYGSEIKQLEAKNRQLTHQLEQTKTNYEQYKKRAHTLLEKNKTQQTEMGRINELQDLVQQLESAKTQYELEQQNKAQQQALLQRDLRQAIDKIHELEASQNVLIKARDDNEMMMKSNFEIEKKSLENKLSAMTAALSQATQQLSELESKNDVELQQDRKEFREDEEMKQSLAQLKVRLDELEATNQSLLQQLRDKDNEIEKLIIATPTSPPPADEQQVAVDSPSETPPAAATDVYASMSNLLSPLVSRQLPDERVGLEKQVQRLSMMLHESEEKVVALKSQEKILKDELRKVDAFEKRQDMNVEYLKNVLVKFLMSENKQTMVPILAKLLCLDETETNTLMENCN